MFGAALVFEAGPLPDRASSLMHQSYAVIGVSVMSNGLPDFGIADRQISSSAPRRTAHRADRRSELVAESFNEIDQPRMM
jgi:hypothetical protein